MRSEVARARLQPDSPLGRAQKMMQAWVSCLDELRLESKAVPGVMVPGRQFFQRVAKRIIKLERAYSSGRQDMTDSVAYQYPYPGLLGSGASKIASDTRTVGSIQSAFLAAQSSHKTISLVSRPSLRAASSWAWMYERSWFAATHLRASALNDR